MTSELIAIVGIAILIAADRFLSSLKNRGVDLQRMDRYIAELHQWHAKEDDEGVKIWYVRASLEKSIDELAAAVVKQTDMLRRMHDDATSMRNSINKLADKVEELTK